MIIDKVTPIEPQSLSTGFYDIKPALCIRKSLPTRRNEGRPAD